MALTTSPPLLDPLRFPLQGNRLIEASAGTGKTFTIAALYLRLVLGHGNDAGHAAAYPRALTPPEILVVTFTDAATKELRDRIRARLAEAAGYFRENPDDVALREAGEDLLYDLRADYPPEAWPGCARKLQVAAEWMDEAAVSTIHGWCNRMLREHAFDSDSLFTQTLETDQSDMLAEVVRDYWRTFLYRLDADDVATLLQWWTNPEALQQQLRNLIKHTDTIGSGDTPAQALAHAREAAMQALAAIKAPWTAWIDELRTLFESAAAARQIDARKLQKRYYEPWLQALQEWATTPMVMPALRDAAWHRLSPDGLAECWKEGFTPPDHPSLDDMLTLRQRLAQLPSAREDVLRHATRWVADRFEMEQDRRAQIGFDDLLTRLDSALQGTNGERLATLIRAQFPVAMIDEFQDTDPLQYRIFNTIYHVADHASAGAPDLALILIGDPKQAIYAFRGADIHTYLAARRDTGERHYTLGTNYRSTGAMVAATNHCFAQAEARPEGQGAFLFRRATGGNPLPFLPVRANGLKDRWSIDDTPATALTAWVIDDGNDLGVTAYRQRFAQSCATEIVRLLQLGQQGRAGFTGPNGVLKPLLPGDIAVLVNTGKEAQAVRRALAVGGVRSIYLSDKESVFQSDVANELQRWLMACAEPEDDRLLRAALASATLGLSWEALDRLNNDETALEERVVQFRYYRQRWRRQGVLPMLRRLLNDFSVPRRLLATNNERALTDLLHLAELLQQASVTLDGEHALIRHLAEQRDDASDENDVRKLRLESDADLVKVVTVHKSKGLEYPLVFLPFACSFREVKAQDLPLKWHDADDRLHVDLSGSPAIVDIADQERLGEDLRKLYVALTRARFATWVGIAPLKSVHRSALGYLLNGGEPIGAGTLHTVLQTFKADCADIRIDAAPAFEATRFTPLSTTVPLAPPRPLRLAPREPWWIASYTALQNSMSGDAIRDDDADGVEDDFGDNFSDDVDEDLGTDLGRSSLDDARTAAREGARRRSPDTAAEDVFAESVDDGARQTHRANPAWTPLEAAAAQPAGDSLHAFPRGPNPGSFLHGLLEWAGEWTGQQGFARVLSDPAATLDVIARRCNLRGWSRWIAPLQDWLTQLVDVPLRLPHDVSVRLADLGPYQVEMEFWFAVHQVNARRLDRLVSAHTLDGATRPALSANQLNGMLKGFIDLVFEHEGRYYVADYKSNWLGPTDADYSETAMREVILAKRYDLQYVLYLFALHRLLRARLPDYDYDRHVGGAVYLFLRGSRAASQGLFCARPPRSLIEALDVLFSAPIAPGETFNAAGDVDGASNEERP